MNRGQLPTNHLHDINRGALDHASRAPQLVSCNCYACVCVHVWYRERGWWELMLIYHTQYWDVLKPAIQSDLAPGFLDKLQSHFGFTWPIPAEMGTTDRMCCFAVIAVLQGGAPKKNYIHVHMYIPVNQQNLEWILEKSLYWTWVHLRGKCTCIYAKITLVHLKFWLWSLDISQVT